MGARTHRALPAAAGADLHTNNHTCGHCQASLLPRLQHKAPPAVRRTAAHYLCHHQWRLAGACILVTPLQAAAQLDPPPPGGVTHFLMLLAFTEAVHRKGYAAWKASNLRKGGRGRGWGQGSSTAGQGGGHPHTGQGTCQGEGKLHACCFPSSTCNPLEHCSGTDDSQLSLDEPV